MRQHDTFCFRTHTSLQSLPSMDALSDLETFPHPGSKATCPHLMLDENVGEPRNWRSPRFFTVPDGVDGVNLEGFNVRLV